MATKSSLEHSANSFIIYVFKIYEFCAYVWIIFSLMSFFFRWWKFESKKYINLVKKSIDLQFFPNRVKTKSLNEFLSFYHISFAALYWSLAWCFLFILSTSRKREKLCIISFFWEFHHRNKFCCFRNKVRERENLFNNEWTSKHQMALCMTENLGEAPQWEYPIFTLASLLNAKCETMIIWNF